MAKSRSHFFLFLTAVVILIPPAASNAAGAVLINEIAWMGTAANSADEWIELYNTTASPIDFSGWGLYEAGGSTLILNLSGTVPANGYYLIERTDDNSVLDIAADVFGPFAGSGLNNSGEYLVLKNSSGTVIDSVDALVGWPAGDSVTKASMERKSDGSWKTNDGVTVNGKDAQGNFIKGTPKVTNSGVSSTAITTPPATSSSSNQSASSDGSGFGTNASSAPVLKAVAGVDVVIEAGKPISFSGLASQGATTYKWYLGDGSAKNGAEITHIYQYPGTYLVTLEVASGQETDWDQIKVNIFGGKVVINELFLPLSSSSAQWLEIFNPNTYGIDLAGWILETGGSGFVFPPFVVVTPRGFLVLSQETTGLDLYQNKSVKLKYPDGTAVDEVFFENAVPGSSASRANNGFFWSKEPTPGRVNIIVSSALSEKTAFTAKKVAIKSELSQPANYLASFYSVVEELPSQSPNTLADSGEIFQQTGFWQKLAGELLFWVVLAVLVGLIVGLFYVKLVKIKNKP